MRLTTTVEHEARALWRDGRGKVLAVVALPWGLLVGSRMALPVLLPHLQAGFGLSLTAAGLLITILWLGGAIGQLPGGVLADRHSEAVVMATSALLVALALTLVVLAPNVVVLFAAIAAWGLGHSLYPIARITVLSDVYPKRLGSALGLTMATGDIGQTVLPPIAGALAIAFIWQAGLVVVIPFLVVGAVGIWLVVPRSPGTDSAVDALSADTFRYVLDELRRPTMVFMGFILFLFIMIWQAFTAFYPTYLVTVKGLSPTVASVLFGVFFAAGAIVKPIGGIAYDRIGMRWALVLVLVGPVGGLFLLPVVDGLVLLLPVTVIVSTMLGSGAITQSFLADQFAPDIRGTGLGAVRTTAALLGAAGPVVFGGLADRGYFDEGYIALAVIMVVVILLILRMPGPADGR